ncbi:MAG: family 1 extracellular solute-binding protein [Paenibacillus sp.]|nr:family 1 extracellular solute-binding protein [Paenibacillus sp.]
MNLLKKGVLLPATIAITASVLYGCGGQDAAKEEKAPAAKTVNTNEAFTLTFFNATGSNEDYFRKNTEPYMKKVFPNATINYIQTGKGSTIEELITAGTIPDIMLISSAQINTYNNLGVLEDLTPLAKTNNVDLTRYDDNMMTTIKNSSSKGAVFVIPWSHLPMSLYYNKAIFDKFGVAYPKDGLTWDDIADLTRKLSRTDGGIAYRGFDMNRATYLRTNQLGLSYVDAKTEKATANTDAWRSLLSTFANLYKIPGNELPASNPGAVTAFFKQQTVAMYVDGGNFPSPENTELVQAWENIDLVTLPVFKSAPDMGTQYTGAAMAVSNSSKLKDQAMRMIAAATSDEAEKHGATIVRYPTVKAKDVFAAFGQGTPQLKTKNLQSMQKLKVAPSTYLSKYDAATLSIMTKLFDDLAKGAVDIATGLRQADEAINLKIAEEKAKGK